MCTRSSVAVLSTATACSCLESATVCVYADSQECCSTCCDRGGGYIQHTYMHGFIDYVSPVLRHLHWFPLRQQIVILFIGVELGRRMLCVVNKKTYHISSKNVMFLLPFVSWLICLLPELLKNGYELSRNFIKFNLFDKKQPIRC